MASQWYVQVNNRVRGPISFQDVAFLIRDQQLSEDGLVRRSDLEQWQPANTVVGLLRAARMHRGDDEYVEINDSTDVKNEPQLTDQERRWREREKIFRKTEESLRADEPDLQDRRTFIENLFLWGPASLLAASVAYAGWKIATYEPFAGKQFESD